MGEKVSALKDRVVGSGKISTGIGSLLGVAIAGAAKYFETTHDVSSWYPYAIAGVTAVAGALYKKASK